MVFSDVGIKYSVIIPCYNESARLRDKITNFTKILDARKDVELIFVDDGSVDGTKYVIPAFDRIKVYSYSNNGGKWQAIRRGWSIASGRYCILSDADFSYNILDFIGYIEMYSNIDGVLIGNRYNPVNELPFDRWFASRVFNRFARIICGISVCDSQSPAKVWSNSVNVGRVRVAMKENGFAADVEFLALCKKMGIKIKEIDIPYRAQGGSTVSIRKHSMGMLKSLFRIRRNVANGGN